MFYLYPSPTTILKNQTPHPHSFISLLLLSLCLFLRFDKLREGFVSSNGHGEVCCCLALGPHCHFHASNHGGSFFLRSIYIFYYEQETNFIFTFSLLFCLQVLASHGHGGHHHDNNVCSLSLSLSLSLSHPKLTKCGGVLSLF
jgi:hypothetical protein